MTKKRGAERDEPSRAFDLGERTALFGEDVIRFLRALPNDAITSPLITQLVRSSTSIGANYSEADEGGTKKEFRYRISLCKRESRESKHWLRMIATAVPNESDRARELWREAHELNLIFAAIFRNSIPTESP